MHALPAIEPSEVVIALVSAHGVQVPEPVAALYLPNSQRVHGSPSLPLAPALHVHCISAVLASGELLRTGHVTQTPAPIDDLYLPTSQMVHGPPLFPE
jgi:hypothetical protein